MDMEEFNDVVKPYPHGDDELIFDVRAFGTRQIEAIESYLSVRLVHVNTTRIGNTERLVVLLCDAAVGIPERVTTLIEDLAANGQWVEIRRGCAPRVLAKTA